MNLAIPAFDPTGWGKQRHKHFLEGEQRDTAAPVARLKELLVFMLPSPSYYIMARAESRPAMARMKLRAPRPRMTRPTVLSAFR